MILKNRINFLVFSIFILSVILSFSYSADAAWKAGGDNNSQKAFIAYLRDGDSAEVEFKINSTDGKNPFFMIGAGDQCASESGVKIIKKEKGWVCENMPGRIKPEIPWSGESLPVKIKSVNLLKISRKKDRIFFKLNGTHLATVPFEEPLSFITLETRSIEVEYRWKKRGFREESMYWQFDIQGGHYDQSLQEHQMFDGDTMKHTFEIEEIHQDPQWANSIVLMIDNTQLWLNIHKGKIYPSLNVWNGKQEEYKTALPLNKDENEVTVSRQGDELSFTLNGTFLFKCTHRADVTMNEGWYVTKRLVGLKVDIRSEKIKTDAVVGSKKSEWSAAAPPKKDVHKGMMTVDTLLPAVTIDTPPLIKLKDGETVRIYFDIIRGYSSRRASTDVGFDLDDKRFYIRKHFRYPFYLLDPDNTHDFAQMIPYELKDGINYIDYKRKGKTYKIYLNGRFMQSYKNTASSPTWELKIRAFGMKVKYRVERLGNQDMITFNLQ